MIIIIVTCIVIIIIVNIVAVAIIIVIMIIMITRHRHINFIIFLQAILLQITQLKVFEHRTYMLRHFEAFF